jgi:hypothetical protein
MPASFFHKSVRSVLILYFHLSISIEHLFNAAFPVHIISFSQNILGTLQASYCAILFRYFLPIDSVIPLRILNLSCFANLIY